jgi:L-aspartate oxidase
MECLVFARQLRRISLPPAEENPNGGRPLKRDRLTISPPPLADLKAAIAQLRDLCWQVAGVERRGPALVEALSQVHRERLGLERETVWRLLQDLPVHGRLLLTAKQGEQVALHQEWHQRLILAELLIEAALFRQESRGGHFRTDTPSPQPYWRRHSCQQHGRGILTLAVRQG